MIARARAEAGTAGRVVAMVFHPHPLSALRPEQAPGLLTTFERRAALLRACGADEVVRLDPFDGVLSLSPEAFVDAFVRDYAPAAVVEGPDFRFGAGRAGDVGTLRALGKSRGFETIVVEQVYATLRDQTEAPVSSTLVRWLIEHGRVEDGAIALGRPHAVEGVVVRGDRRGRELSMPTANVRTECLAARDGVYAGFATLPGGARRVCAISVGTKPQFGANARAVEAHVLEWCGPGADEPEYGWPIRVEFVAWLRDQLRFESVDALVRQMRADVERTREVCVPDAAVAKEGAGAWA